MTNPKPLTEERLAEIEARTKAATRGDWSVGPDGDTIEVEDEDGGFYSMPCEPRDADLLANAKADIDALTAEVRRLRAALGLVQFEDNETAALTSFAREVIDYALSGKGTPAAIGAVMRQMERP